MIAKLTGEVVDVRVMHIVIDVQGVGYLVAVTHGAGYAIGTRISIHTYLAVRENALDLYGFTTHDELAMFEQLIKLPKIGPKTALQILSQADLTTLKEAVRTDDPTYLTKMSGIGKKSAEKIVAGLKDVLSLDEVTGDHSSAHQADSDVIDALITLGYSQRDALQAVQKIPAEITDTNARIKHALKYISN
jgi:Holliday junction DNA helicase RuvA